ncbi:hypothetical protein D3C86_2203380 [compost metagenome]
MNDALPEPGKKLCAVDRLRPVGFGLRIAVVDEHQIQVRTVPQLQTADFPVTDNDETRVAQAAVGAQRRTVLGHGLAPG